MRCHLGAPVSAERCRLKADELREVKCVLAGLVAEDEARARVDDTPAVRAVRPCQRKTRSHQCHELDKPCLEDLPRCQAPAPPMLKPPSAIPNHTYTHRASVSERERETGSESE